VARAGPLVLCYHAVSERWAHSLSVPPHMLAAQLRVLLRWYQPLPAEKVLAGTRRGMHVTFDDAYRSVANALPTLQRLRVPATVFACSDYASDGRPLGVPELANEVRFQPDELATMRWDELRALSHEGVEVGSHTRTHPHLSELDDSELDRELQESREQIADELRQPCRFLAYPFGEQDERVRQAARRAGYAAAFALPGNFTRLDAFAIPRLGIWRKDRLLRIGAKIALAHGKDRPRAAA